jgi:hypothetical protein
MQEFSSISVSTYNPDELTGQLNERVKDGWNVVAIVPTGSTVTAYLSRDAAGESTAPETDTGTPTGVTAAAATEPAAEPAPEPAPEPAHFEVAGVATTGPEPAPEPAAAQPAPEPAAEPAAAAAPAGWYADPSSRFELRYWDGTTWTEHVSRGGQQFTDPPVA